MKAISLKLPEELVAASEECAAELSVSRAEYIRRAIEQMNDQTRAEIRYERLRHASGKVRRESMRVNAEFEAIEEAPDA